jgi:hypothetical protein
MARILFDTMPSWMKCHDENIDIRKVKKSFLDPIYPTLSRILLDLLTDSVSNCQVDSKANLTCFFPLARN